MSGEILSALANFLSVAIRLWALNTRTENPAWTVQFKHYLRRYVRRECAKIGVPDALTEIYFVVFFEDLATHLERLLLIRKPSLNFLLSGLPRPLRAETKIASTQDLSSFGHRERRALNEYWSTEHAVLFSYARKRLEVVMAVALGKGPTGKIFDPKREFENIEAFLGQCEQLKIDPYITLDYYVWGYSDLMRVASLAQMLTWNNPDVEAYVRDHATTTPEGLTEVSFLDLMPDR